MSKEEKIALAIATIAVAAMIWYDRSRVRSGVVPLVVQEEQRLQSLGDMVVGESGTLSDPTGAAYINRAVTWGWPLPSMLPVATPTPANTGQPI